MSSKKENRNQHVADDKESVTIVESLYARAAKKLKPRLNTAK
ncbi:MAG: hypothetical protein ACTSSG_14780 [Candidatus Heimdallarchaeaceae archaeon]